MAKDKGNSLPLLPINGRIIVLPEEKQKTTASGLYLPDTGSSEKPQFGLVVRVGIEKTDEKGNKIAYNVKEGMKVMFKRYSGDEVEFDGKKYIIMDEDAITAIFED